MIRCNIWYDIWWKVVWGHRYTRGVMKQTKTNTSLDTWQLLRWPLSVEKEPTPWRMLVGKVNQRINVQSAINVTSYPRFSISFIKSTIFLVFLLACLSSMFCFVLFLSLGSFPCCYFGELWEGEHRQRLGLISQYLDGSKWITYFIEKIIIQLFKRKYMSGSHISFDLFILIKFNL